MIIAFDWGGTRIKYGVWQANELCRTDYFNTPKSWAELKEQLKQTVAALCPKTTDLEGVAISVPGPVDKANGVIKGISAIPYIANFPIQTELEALFGVPVCLENDANAAGIAEVWQGAAKGLSQVLFIVLGTGVGGAVIIDGKIREGKHLYGGEFGLLYLDNQHTFSEVGTAVKMAERYSIQRGVEKDTYNAEEVFQLADQGDRLAEKEVEKFYNYVSQALFSLQFTLDPECLVIGGGVSAKLGLANELTNRVEALFNKHGIRDFKPIIKTCQFHNDANLIGAVATFLQRN